MYNSTTSQDTKEIIRLVEAGRIDDARAIFDRISDHDKREALNEFVIFTAGVSLL